SRPADSVQGEQHANLQLLVPRRQRDSRDLVHVVLAILRAPRLRPRCLPPAERKKLFASKMAAGARRSDPLYQFGLTGIRVATGIGPEVVLRESKSEHHESPVEIRSSRR